MGPTWYYVRNKQQVGPVSFEEMQRLAAAGQIIPTDLVWQAGTQKWVMANSVPALFAMIPTSPFDVWFNSMPVLGARKSPEISAILGFVLGGIGLGIYHRSVIDLLLPIFLVLLLSPLHLFGLFGGMVFAGVYGYFRAANSNHRRGEK